MFIQRNPKIFIESTIHAREWITAATTTYILNELLTSNDPEIKAMAANYDWIFIPVVNVDGYVYSHKSVSHMIKRSLFILFYCIISIIFVYRIACGAKIDDHKRIIALA